jgi:hypothetical protein
VNWDFERAFPFTAFDCYRIRAPPHKESQHGICYFIQVFRILLQLFNVTRQC